MLVGDVVYSVYILLYVVYAMRLRIVLTVLTVREPRNITLRSSMSVKAKTMFSYS